MGFIKASMDDLIYEIKKGSFFGVFLCVSAVVTVFLLIGLADALYDYYQALSKVSGSFEQSSEKNKVQLWEYDGLAITDNEKLSQKEKQKYGKYLDELDSFKYTDENFDHAINVELVVDFENVIEPQEKNHTRREKVRVHITDGHYDWVFIAYVGGEGLSIWKANTINLYNFHYNTYKVKEKQSQDIDSLFPIKIFYLFRDRKKRAQTQAELKTQLKMVLKGYTYDKVSSECHKLVEAALTDPG